MAYEAFSIVGGTQLTPALADEGEESFARDHPANEKQTCAAAPGLVTARLRSSLHRAASGSERFSHAAAESARHLAAPCTRSSAPPAARLVPAFSGVPKTSSLFGDCTPEG